MASGANDAAGRGEQQQEARQRISARSQGRLALALRPECSSPLSMKRRPRQRRKSVMQFELKAWPGTPDGYTPNSGISRESSVEVATIEYQPDRSDKQCKILDLDLERSQRPACSAIAGRWQARSDARRLDEAYQAAEPRPSIAASGQGTCQRQHRRAA